MKVHSASRQAIANNINLEPRPNTHLKVAGKQIAPPPSSALIQALAASLPVGIPHDYLHLFRHCNGADIWFEEVGTDDDYDYLRLDPAEHLLDPGIRATLSEVFPDLFVIGSDGGGQVLAYDLRLATESPIILHCPGFSDASNRVVVARSMAELVREYIEA